MRGELELVVGGVVEHAKSVLVEGLVIGLLHVRVGGEAKAHLVHAESWAPLIARRETFGQNGERLGFRLRRLGSRIGDSGR